ncbi:hypothetical protein LTS18_000210, partial [Coniosporium uncinatum]
MAFIVNTAFARFLPQVENNILILHFTGWIVVLATMIALAPSKASAEDVFAVFANGGGYQTQGLSFFVGTVSAVYAFIGADGAVHMAEEIKHASSVVPWGLMGSIIINGVLGFSMLIATLFCMGPIDKALKSTTGFPFLEILRFATGSLAGADGLASIIIALFVSCTIAVYASTSRMMWSFARDLGLPGSRFLSRVEPRTKLPMWSLIATGTITSLLSLIAIG